MVWLLVGLLYIYLSILEINFTRALKIDAHLYGNYQTIQYKWSSAFFPIDLKFRKLF